MEKQKARFLGERQILLCILLTIIGIGYLLFHNKGYTLVEGNQIEESIAMDSSTQLSHKIVGTGGYLDTITYYVKDAKLLEDSCLKVLLLEDTNEFLDDNCVQEVVLYKEQLEGSRLEISFEPVELEFEKDYFIVLAYADGNEEGYIEVFQTDSKVIAPVYGNNIYYGVSLCYDMTLRNSREMFFLKVLFVYLGLASAYSIAYNKRFLVSVGMVSLVLGIAMTSFSFMGILKYSAYIVELFALAGWIYSILSTVFHKKQATKEENVQFVWDVGTFFFVLLICFWGNIDKNALNGDVIVHWALEVKSLFTYDLLPLHEASNVPLYRYPPLYSLYQYLFMNLNGFWSEDVLYIAKYVYITTIVMSCCCSQRMKTRLEEVFLAISSIALMEIIFGDYVIESAYVDEFLGAALGFALIALYRCYVHKENNKIELFLAMCALGLVKESGVILAGIVILGAIIATILFAKREEKKSIILSLVRLGIYVMIYSCIVWYGYIYIIKNQILSVRAMGILFMATVLINIVLILMRKQLAGRLSAKHKKYIFIGLIMGILVVGIIALIMLGNIGFYKVLGDITGMNKENLWDIGYQFEMIFIHIMKLIFYSYFENNLVDLPFAMIFSIIMFIIYALFYKQNTVRMKLLMFCVSFVSFFYILFLHVVFTFTMANEAMTMPSESRYLGTLVFAVMLLLIHIVNSTQDGRELSMRGYVIGIVVIVLLTNGAGIYRNSIEERNIIYEREEYLKDDAMAVRNHIQPEDKILYISKDKYSEYLIYSYIIDPGKVHRHILADSNYQENLEWLESLIVNYDYVYVRTVPNEYWTQVSFIFNDNTEYADDYSLFKVSEKGIIQVY